MSPPAERKGARRQSEIPPKIRAALNRGELETANLVEFLAVDQVKLFQAVRPQLGLNPAAERSIAAAIRRLATAGVMQRLVETGRALFEALPEESEREAVYTILATHTSDTLRNWAAYMDAANPQLTFAQRLRRARRFAIDPNMGVREVAWMSVRLPAPEAIVDQIERLHPLARQKNHLTRRFAIEIARPCGVWCRHLPRLKQRPEIALALLETCRSDPTKYVQDSVANWLNDASKTRPEFVVEVCHRWRAESDAVATRRITHRALRTLRKQGQVT